MNRQMLLQFMIGLMLVLPLGCSEFQPTATPDHIATRVAEEKAVAATLTAEAYKVSVAPLPTEPPRSTLTQTPKAIPTAPLGDVVTDGQWRVAVHSVTRKDNLISEEIVGTKTYTSPKGYSFLLVEIQTTKTPPEERMILGSGSFVVIDSQGGRYTPIGANTSYGILMLPFTEQGTLMKGALFQGFYRSECGEGCEETYEYVLTDEDAWRVTVVKGTTWRQTYVYLLPLEAKGLKFVFKSLPTISLGQ